MPFDIKTIKSALDDFSTFAKNITKLFQKTPEALKDFADKVSK